MSDTQVSETETEAEGEAPAVDHAVEARARRMGWRPREEYRGPPGEFRDATAFIEHAEENLPLAVARNRSLERQVESMTGELGETKALLGTLVERTRRAEEIGYRRARREIEAERDRAIDAGDRDGVREADTRLRELGPEPVAQPGNGHAATQPPAQPAQPQMDPVVQAWIGQNPWFTSNPEANAVAVALHGVVTQQMPHLALDEKLAETTRRMRQRMPELFGQSAEAQGNPRRGAAAAVSPSQSGAPRQTNPRSFDALPPDVKRQYDRQAKMLEGKGDPFTKDEFARYYWEQFEETA